MSLPQIGRFYGDRDHTTILHGAHKIKVKLMHDEALQADVETIQVKIVELINARGAP